MVATAWIASENPDVELCDWRVVHSKSEASVLTEHQAQQLMRKANDEEREYVWNHVAEGWGFVVQGEVRLTKRSPKGVSA